MGSLGVGIPINAREFEGIDLEELPHFERCFSLQLTACCLEEDGTVNALHHPTTTHKEKIYLNVFDKHLSYITDFGRYSSKFKCARCDRLFNRINKMKTHLRICSNVTKLKFPGGIYRAPSTIYEDLADFDINVPVEDQFFEQFAVFDFEALLKDSPQQTSEKLKWTTEHVPISVSVCSSVPEFELPRCFVSPDVDVLMEEMVKYLDEIASASQALAHRKWVRVITALEQKIEKWRPGDLDEREIMNEEIEVVETVEEEASSQRFLDAIAKPNSYRRFQARLNEGDEWQVEYNNYEEEEVANDVDDDVDNDDGDDGDDKNGNLIMYNALNRLSWDSIPVVMT